MEFEHFLKIVLVQNEAIFGIFLEWDTEAGLDVNKLAVYAA
jgi:hypothetical protein